MEAQSRAKVHEMTSVKTGHQVTVVESKHPSDPEQQRHTEAYCKAVAFTNVLRETRNEDAAEAAAKVVGDRVARENLKLSRAGGRYLCWH